MRGGQAGGCFCECDGVGREGVGGGPNDVSDEGPDGAGEGGGRGGEDEGREWVYYLLYSEAGEWDDDSRGDKGGGGLVSFVCAGSLWGCFGGGRGADGWCVYRNKEVDKKTTEAILRRAKVLGPELMNAEGEFDVVSEQVGFRPSREDGPRVELAEIDGKRVVHSYGHSGAGSVFWRETHWGYTVC